jgi:crossover junction endodeoxyribonuclease RuvC
MGCVLGLDPGFGRLGFGAIATVRGTTRVLDCGIISTDKDTPFGERLVQLADDLETLLDQLKPSRIVVEKLFFTKNAKTAMQVAEARGVLLYLAAKRRIPVLEYTPSQVKSAVCGDGKADKKAIQKMVKMLLGLKSAPKIDDAADALALALMGAAIRE